MKSARVIVVDGFPQSRAALMALLGSHSGISVVAYGECAADVVELVERLHPDVFIVDLESLPSSAFEVLQSVSRDHPDIFIVAIGMWAGDKRRAIAAGAAAFHVKTDSPELLLRTILSLASK